MKTKKNKNDNYYETYMNEDGWVISPEDDIYDEVYKDNSPKDELWKFVDENTNIDTIKSIYEYIVKTNKVSTNLIQREFNLGFNSVYKVIQLFELYGIVSPYDQGTRNIIGTTNDLEQLIKDVKERLDDISSVDYIMDEWSKRIR